MKKMGAEAEYVYYYKGQVLKVVDGDTVDVDIDLGFDVHFKTRLRLYGVNTPELSSKNPDERKKADDAKNFLKELIEGKEIEIQSFKQEKYGRYLAKIFINNVDVNQKLIEEGFAVPYFGGPR
jgi:micrococcal nuclease